MGPTVGGLDLAQERAALASEQRKAVEIRNAVALGEYARISLLAEVLAAASQAVAERLDHLPGAIKTKCPEMPAAARDQVMAVIADARNLWVSETVALVTTKILTSDDPAELGELVGEQCTD